MIGEKNIIKLKNIDTNAIIKNYFFKDHSSESDVEYAFLDMYKHMFNDDTAKIGTKKSKMKGFNKKSVVHTDGEIYMHIDNKLYVGLQETKYKKSMTDLFIKKHLSQALAYNYLKRRENYEDIVNGLAPSSIEYSFIILNSESYFLLIDLKDYNELLNKTDDFFNEYTKSPSWLANNPLPDGLKKIYDSLNLHFKAKDIYNNFNLTKEFITFFNNK